MGWRDEVESWTTDARDAWAERAASLQYDGGLTRDEAEVRAYIAAMAPHHREGPRSVPDARPG